MKVVPLVLTGVVVAAAAGRFYAEAEVRRSEQALSALQQTRAEVEYQIGEARLHKEVLESAGRLSELNAERLALGTVRSEQLLDEREAAQVLGLDAPTLLPAVTPEADTIGNAIGMAELNATAGVVNE